MARYQDGVKVPTSLFEAAAWHYAVKVACGCGHFAVFDPYGLFWHFHCKGWPDSLVDAKRRLWCKSCRASLSQKVRPRRIDLMKPYTGSRIILPLPDEREWKLIINRYRG